MASDRQKGAPADHPPGSPRVLVVDDDPNLLAFLEQGLRRQGFEVETASSAESGLELLGLVFFDAAVLDVMLPGKDGFSLLQEVKAKLPALPVVMLTAKDGDRDIFEGWRKGADAYLTKPFTVEEVVLMVKGLLKDKAKYGSA